MNTFDRARVHVLSLVMLPLLGLAACESSPGSPVEPTSVLPSGPSLASESGGTGTAHVLGAGENTTRASVTLDQVRRATAHFKNIDVALASGYVDDGFGCIDATVFGLDPSVGGMGFHLINWALHDDPETDGERPDLLVYEPAASPRGKPTLVALEYEVFRPDWYAAGHTDPPSLFGHEFESFDFDGLEIFGLHLWLWRDNPSGLFSDFNPKVQCPTGESKGHHGALRHGHKG